MSDVSFTDDSDVRIIPQWLLDVVLEFDGRPRIGLDVCTPASNPLNAHHFYEGHCRNGLELSWRSSEGITWCNGPYSRGQVIQWAEKAAYEARLGAEILMLTKSDPRTAWTRCLVANSDARCAVARGVGFLEPDGNGGYVQLHGPMWGSAVWYFGPRRRRFDSVFSRIGEVTHYLGPQEATP